MVVQCEDVWREISNYIEDDIDPSLRAAMEEHFHGCQHCTAVLEGTRNVVQIYGDERMFELPLGFSHRMQRRLHDNIAPSRRSFLGWMVAAAAAIVTVGGFELAKSSIFSHPELKSQLAQPATGVPPELIVVVSTEGKIFHGSTKCPFMLDKVHVRSLVAREAQKEGYAPCVRCMKQYLIAG